MIRRHQITVTLTGASGSEKSTQPVNGLLLAAHIDYADIAAGTTDVTLAVLDPTLTLLTVTNSVTDGWFYPRVLMGDTAGVNLTAVYDAMAVHGYVEVSVVQADAGTVTVTLLVEE